MDDAFWIDVEIQVPVGDQEAPSVVLLSNVVNPLAAFVVPSQAAVLGVRYQDDCFRFDVTYQRSFIRDQDIEPDERFLVNFALKYLGNYNANSSAFGGFSDGDSN